jgi:hypothetical protein
MLTALQVSKIAILGKHSDSTGLFLEVTAARVGVAKSWLFRFTSPVTGKERSQGLDSYPEISFRRRAGGGIRRERLCLRESIPLTNASGKRARL